MVKTKKSKRSGTRRGRAKAAVGRRVAKHPAPVMFTAGALISGAAIATSANKSGYTPYKAYTAYGAKSALEVIAQNAKTTSNLVPLGVGALASVVGPKLPFIGKEANKLVRDLTHGKGRL